MRYALQILFYVVAWRSLLLRAAETSPVDPQSLKLISKDVESVLSPTLVDELKGAQSNRTAVNVDQTVARNSDALGSITDKKPEVHFDNQIYPFHYERSYHYEYPPPSKKSLLHPTGITERFYSPYFRPKNHVVDTRDSRYYKTDPSNESSIKNEGTDESARASSTNGDSPTIREVERLENPESDRRRTYDYGPSRFFYDPDPLPPNGFAHRDILRPSSPTGAFPAVDFDRFRESVIARSAPSRNGYYFGPNGDAVTYRNEPYSPRDEGKLPDPRQSQPLETFDNPAPPNSYQNYPNGAYPVPPQRSQYYPPGFLGSFFHPDDSAAFYDNYRPSPGFANRFGDNFTSNFPPRSAFGGFYPRNYVPIPAQPNPLPSPDPGSPETAQAEYIRPRAISEPIPATKPNEPNPESTPAASNSNYQVRLFVPGKNDDFEIERFESFSF